MRKSIKPTTIKSSTIRSRIQRNYNYGVKCEALGLRSKLFMNLNTGAIWCDTVAGNTEVIYKDPAIVRIGTEGIPYYSEKELKETLVYVATNLLKAYGWEVI